VSLTHELEEFLAEEPTAPEMAAPGGTPPTKDALEAALAAGPVMAGDWWELDFKPIEPVLYRVDGAKPLLYAGMSHAFIGEPGRGKSMLGQKLLVEMAGDGQTALFVDLEKDYLAFRERIRALGATKETAGRIGYWRLTRGLTDKAVDRIVAFCAEWRVSVVVIDSVGRALSRAGLDENSNDDVRRWYDGCVEPLLRAGLTVVLIDHFKKPSGDGSSRGGSPSPAGRYAKGAGAKLDVITGAAYGVEFVKPFSRVQSGMAKVITAKDNNGTRCEGEVACEVLVEPHDGGARIDMQLVSPKPLPTNADGSKRYTYLMEQVSKFVEAAETPPSLTVVETSVSGAAIRVRAAVEVLITEGFLTQQVGPRNAKLLTSAKPYREAQDSLTAPAPGSGDSGRPRYRRDEPL
jgi:hypothetical protein